MKFKSTWLMIAAFAALGAYFAFVEEPRHRANSDAQEKEGLLFPGFDPARVTEVTLESPGGRTRLVQAEGSWSLAEPVEDRADAGRVRELLEGLKALKSVREVAPTGSDPGPYGLAAPEVVIRTAGSAAALAVGAENPAADARYVRAGEGPTVLAPAYAVSGLLVQPRDLRDKSVLPSFPWNRLTSVAVAAAGKPRLRLEKAGAGWRLTEPAAAEADPDAAEGVAEKLRWAKATSFLDDTAESAAPKLSAGYTVTFAAEGEARPSTVRLAEVGNEVWATAEGRRALFTLPREVLDAFRQGPEALARTKPVLTKTWSAEKLSFRTGGASIAYERHDGAWRREGRPVTGAESERLQDVLAALEETRAVRVLRAPAPPAGYGLDAPRFTVELVDSQQGAQTLALGASGGRDYARAGAAGPVYEMPSSYASRVEALWKASPTSASAAKAASP